VSVRVKGRRRPAVEREDGRHGRNVNRLVVVPVILAAIVARADAGDSSNNLSRRERDENNIALALNQDQQQVVPGVNGQSAGTQGRPSGPWPRR
jgi:hypothetical protein